MNRPDARRAAAAVLGCDIHRGTHEAAGRAYHLDCETCPMYVPKNMAPMSRWPCGRPPASGAYSLPPVPGGPTGDGEPGEEGIGCRPPWANLPRPSCFGRRETGPVHR